jgi:AraC-like DNA-binding protein
MDEDPATGYRELPPRVELRDHLSCLWFRVVPPGEPAERVLVLPDACVDVVWRAGSAPSIAGPDTGPVPCELPAGTVIVGARFRTGLAPSLLGVAASELRDAQAPLEAAWGGAEARRLEEAEPAGSAAGMLEVLQDALVRHLATGPGADPLIPPVVAWAARPATPGLDHLVRELGISERTLRRRVEERVGYGPKTLHRVLRFQRMLRLGKEVRSLADLAAMAGYADQAHMTRESRRLAGLTPARLLTDSLPAGGPLLGPV